MAEVHAENLVKLFKSKSEIVRAVDSINVEIPDHEFAVFVGPSGSGKTTFLRLVAGLEVPTSGRISIGDRDVTTLHPRERGIAMVFQDYALYPHMTVAENMSFALQNLKFPKAEIEQRVMQAAKMLRMETLLARKPRQCLHTHHLPVLEPDDRLEDALNQAGCNDMPDPVPEALGGHP